MLRFLTAGESHGPALVVIIDGVPAGLALSADDIARDLARRQLGYGRGRRMAIERDRAEILSGVRHGKTIGSPIALKIDNRDWTNWQHSMAVEPADDLPRRAAPLSRARGLATPICRRHSTTATTCAMCSNAPARRETAASLAPRAPGNFRRLRHRDREPASPASAAAVSDPSAVTF